VLGTPGLPLKRFPHQGEEAGLFGVARDRQALELAVELDVDVEAACILVEVQERVRPRAK
jgi:hypothetical protein